MSRLAVVVFCVATTAVYAGRGQDNDTLVQLEKDLQAIVAARSEHWNCSFSVSIKSGGLVVNAAAPSDGASVQSKFAWGSITKMWTAASIMQFVAQKKLSLTQPVAPLLDAQFKKMKAIDFPVSCFSDMFPVDAVSRIAVMVRYSAL